MQMRMKELLMSTWHFFELSQVLLLFLAHSSLELPVKKRNPLLIYENPVHPAQITLPVRTRILIDHAPCKTHQKSHHKRTLFLMQLNCCNHKFDKVKPLKVVFPERRMVSSQI